MKLTYAHLCDYATVSREGKVSVMGIFSELRFPKYPHPLPSAFLVFELEASAGEVGRKVDVEITCMGQDGQPLFKMGGALVINLPPGVAPKPGEMHRSSQILGVNGLMIPSPGPYQVDIFVNGDLKATVGFEAAQIVPPASQ